MKSIYVKRENQNLFLRNSTEKPEIVLIFPITRDAERSIEKWGTVLKFVENSEINTLLVIDKTEQGSATEYFMSHFELKNKALFVLPRSINDTLFDTVGEIIIDKNMWIIQIHDDDHWSGRITLPDVPDPGTVYFSNFYLHSEAEGMVQIDDFSMPNRIVFSLVPSIIWNRFSKVVQDQKYHVAGSFDFTLNVMTQLSCKFKYQPGFEYFWKDDNWDTSKNSIGHLTRLAERDGWEGWSSPEIANFNRSIDSLASINCIKDLLDSEVIERKVGQIIRGLKPSYKKAMKYRILIPALRVLIAFRRMVNSGRVSIFQRSLKVQKQLSLYKFISVTWQIESIENAIDTVNYLESLEGFEKLQIRFQFWKESLSELSREL